MARKPCLTRAHDQVGVPSGLTMACSVVAGGMSVGTRIWERLIRSNGALDGGGLTTRRHVEAQGGLDRPVNQGTFGPTGAPTSKVRQPPFGLTWSKHVPVFGTLSVNTVNDSSLENRRDSFLDIRVHIRLNFQSAESELETKIADNVPSTQALIVRFVR